MGVEKKNGGANVHLIVTGAIASCFVGIMYAYSYLKSDIKEYWQYEAGTDMNKRHDYADMVENGYFAGFTGQYLAPIPGLIFDLFGETVTCWYGGIFCAIGFTLMGVATASTQPTLLVVAVFMAGLGSKGLGFGALLGTMKALDDSYATFISGLYLSFDALSSIFAIYMKDLFFETPKEDKEKGENVCIYFTTLGLLIGGVGIAAGFMYLFFGAKNEEIEEDEEEEQMIGGAQSARVSRMSVNDEERRRSSLVREAELITMQRVVKEPAYKSNGDEEDGLVEKERPEKRTFWPGVICCFVIMILSESQGLAFNSLVGDVLIASRKASTSLLSYDFLTPPEGVVSSGKFPSVKEDLYEKDKLEEMIMDKKTDFMNSDVTDEQRVDHKILVVKLRDSISRQFDNMPSLMTYKKHPKDTTKFIFQFETSDPASGLQDNRMFVLKKELTAAELDEQLIRLDATGKEIEAHRIQLLTEVNFFRIDLMGLLPTLLEDGLTTPPSLKLKPKSALEEAVRALSPIAGWQEHFASKDKNTDVVKKEDSELVLISHVISDKKSKFEQTFDTSKDAKGKNRPEYNLMNRDLESPDTDAISLVSLQKKTGKKSKDEGAALHKQLFQADTLTQSKMKSHQGKVEPDKDKRQFIKLFYPDFTNDVKELQKLPFRRFLLDVVAVDAEGNRYTGSGDKWLKLSFVGGRSYLHKVGAGQKDEKKIQKKKAKDLKIIYDEKHFLPHKDAVKDTKRWLTIIFSLGNAAGRLGLGLIADRLARSMFWMPAAFWFMIGSVAYFLVFSGLWLGGVPCTKSPNNDPGTHSKDAPEILYFIVFFVAFCYGGVFTINTAYLKQITASGIGIVLGGSLLVLAGGCMFFGKFGPTAKVNNDVDKDRGDDVSMNLRETFFVAAAVCQLLALVPAAFCWWHQANDAKMKKLAEEELEDEDDL